MYMQFLMSPMSQILKLKNPGFGNSLTVQWLGFGAFTAVAWVQSLVGELRYCKPQGMAKKKGERVKKEIVSYN